MEIKNAIVTGATGAIGKAIARQILAKGIYHVIMVVRNEQKAKQVLEDISGETHIQSISYEITDLSRKQDIFDLAGRIKEPVNILVNNAAQCPRQRAESRDGIELQWATNVLGYLWMMEAFTPHLTEGAPSRIVNVASYWAGDLDLSDPEFRKRRYNNDLAYRQSKQANRMLTVAFAQRLMEKGITVNSCHPGDVNSRLSNDLGYGGHETLDQGANTPAWLATSPDVAGITGKYFADRREQYCGFSRDKTEIEMLYKLCETY